MYADLVPFITIFYLILVVLGVADFNIGILFIAIILDIIDMFL